MGTTRRLAAVTLCICVGALLAACSKAIPAWYLVRDDASVAFAPCFTTTVDSVMLSRTGDRSHNVEGEYTGPSTTLTAGEVFDTRALPEGWSVTIEPDLPDEPTEIYIELDGPDPLWMPGISDPDGVDRDVWILAGSGGLGDPAPPDDCPQPDLP